MADNNVMIDFRYVKRGASGATDMKGVVEVYVNHAATFKESQGGNSELPDTVFRTGGPVRIRVITESVSEWRSAVVGADALEVLKVGFRDSDAGAPRLRVWTFDKVKVITPQEGKVPSREESGKVPRYTVEFMLVQGATAKTLAEAWTEAADT
ncbi:MAG: hypothetical protein SF069_02965 [Phycisphaerae bacterium]|nr:hypothetical protein [Phycisphaerae bacterium]